MFSRRDCPPPVWAITFILYLYNIHAGPLYRKNYIIANSTGLVTLLDWVWQTVRYGCHKSPNRTLTFSTRMRCSRSRRKQTYCEARTHDLLHRKREWLDTLQLNIILVLRKIDMVTSKALDTLAARVNKLYLTTVSIIIIIIIIKIVRADLQNGSNFSLATLLNHQRKSNCFQWCKPVTYTLYYAYFSHF